jgi:hypothetical protein
MKYAIPSSIALLIVASPFTEAVYIAFLLACIGFASVLWLVLRDRAPEVDEVQLQCELEGFVRDLNSEGGK